jgi:electron-transferring-flavoprotein dehydrogenase
VERESMEFDLVIVGAGPAGLSAAIRFKQLCQEAEVDYSVCLVEKGSEIGAHILSGAILEPTAMNELFPDWRDMGTPLNTPTTHDDVYYLFNAKQAMKVPGIFVPSASHNKGNYAISLGNLCRWLGEQAEALGVEIFPGFTASEVLYHDDGSVKGIATGDMGIGADGEQKPSYQAGYELHAKYTLFTEGCRGHLGKQLMEKFDLQANAGTQHYAIGIKELWDIDPDKHFPGKVIHSVGYPLDHGPGGATGGSFMYHLENNQVALGLIVDLSYSNPHLSPFDEFQRYKMHPVISHFLEGGKRVSYGARAINKGGFQAVPKIVFPGGLMAGDDAGFMNFLKIKGTHNAMKTGMLASESVFAAVKGGSEGHDELDSYTKAYEASWVYKELHKSRNVNPAIHKFGVLMGAAFAFVDQTIFQGKLPFTLSDPTPDHEMLKPAAKCKPTDYPKPDGVITFDKTSSVFLSATNHEEDQPCHLQLADPDIPLQKNLPMYNEPAQLYCPVGVYEVLEEDDGSTRFQINAQNCVHCKTCDIKDPAQNITWVAPEGAGGPNYPNM